MCWLDQSSTNGLARCTLDSSVIDSNQSMIDYVTQTNANKSDQSNKSNECNESEMNILPLIFIDH
uniref:Uncharacterized protein n=1 Tax=Rhizophagus irregularis (strain DAOM 181602 / DAOM 197198 / MUCL 43194) TaxID=747089 RepID=U9U285_RHIID